MMIAWTNQLERSGLIKTIQLLFVLRGCYPEKAIKSKIDLLLKVLRLVQLKIRD